MITSRTVLFALVALASPLAAAKRHRTPITNCSQAILPVRMHFIELAVGPEFRALAKRKGIEMPVLLEQVVNLMDTIHFRQSQIKPPQHVATDVRLTEAQAIELIYAATARGYDVNFLQTRLASYRFADAKESTESNGAARYRVDSMEDFIRAFYADKDSGIGPIIARPRRSAIYIEPPKEDY